MTRTNPLRPEVRQTATRGEWELCEDLWVHRRIWAWKIPRGFRFDFASVPRFIRPLIQTTDLDTAPPCVHDYLYRRGGDVGGITYTRAEADQMFRDLMKVARVPRWRRFLAYHAVRRFGAHAWQSPSTLERAA